MASNQSSYIVLARKWRPAQFADIVGQTSVVRTFTNAVQNNRVHQAYLFTGSRGVGKTSIARIFSKALRCENTVFTKELGLKTCDECSNCKEIAAGTSVDVREIDGASNNGVDAIREIRDNVRYLPSTGNRKIYIIDEVHMLTTAAFNALLKTLEEPPEHIVFIFATTEPHKIPPTILSRCQRFDFKRVTLLQIQERLQKICSAEGIETDSASLALIAKAAEGSMRDALSLLDQVVAFAGNSITLTDVRDSIGAIGNAPIFQFLEAIFKRNSALALATLQEVFEQGHDLKIFTKGILETLHAILLLKSQAPEKYLSDYLAEEIAELKSISAYREIEEIELIFQAFHFAQESISRSSNPKISLDVLAIKTSIAEALIQTGPENNTSAPTPRPAQMTTPVSVAASVTPSASPPAPQAKATVTTHNTSTAEAPLTWESFIQNVRAQRPLLGSILEHGHPKNWPSAGQKEWTILFHKDNQYYIDQIQTKLYVDQLNQISKLLFGFNVFFKFESTDQINSIADRKQKTAEESKKTAIENVKNHPMIREAQALFGGELGPIETAGGAGRV